MTQLFANAARSETTRDMTAGDISLYYREEDIGLFPEFPQAGDTFKLVLQDEENIEVVTAYSALSDYRMYYVRRGQEGTTAREWPAGTAFGLRWTAGDARAAMQIAEDLNTHKSSGDHDGRYPTHAQVDYRFGRQATAVRGPENVLMLAVAPIGYKGLNDIVEVVEAISQDYDMYVITNEWVGRWTDPDYDTTEVIVQLLRERGVKVYGVGDATYEPDLEDWLDLGVDGMFINSFQMTGPGANATRADQIAWVNAVHEVGMCYMAGSVEYQDVFSDAGRDPLPRTPRDTFIVLDYISSSGVYPSEAGEITTYLRRITEANTDGMKIVGRMRIAESENGGPDLSNWGNLDTLDKAADYAWGVASLYGLDGVAVSGASEGSAGGSTVIGASRRILPPDLGVPSGKVLVSGDQLEATRRFSKGTLTITTEDGLGRGEWAVSVTLDAPMVDAARAYSKLQTDAVIDAAIKSQATATAGAAGVVQLATIDEARAFANNTKAITPLTLGASLNATSLGFGQEWVDLLPQRAVNVTYTNTTGRPIAVAIAYWGGGYGTQVPLSLGLMVNGEPVSVFFGGDSTTMRGTNISAIIPQGGTYRLVSDPETDWELAIWKELR